MTSTMKIIEANASAFIIPNHASLASEFCDPDSMKRRAQEICDLNNMPYDPESDHLIQIWIHSDKDLDTDNLEDHGGTVMIDGEPIGFYCSCGMIPETFFKGHREGDVIDIKLLANNEKSRRMLVNMKPMILHLHLTLQQQGYRYHHLGEFQDALRLVTR